MQKHLFIVLVLLLAIVLVTLGEKDFYSILGVPRNADNDQIRKAYKKLAMKHHPDRNKGDKESETKFLDISRAYEVLSDPKQRQIYDKYGEEGLKKNNAGAGHSQGGFGDIFGDLFGGGFHFNFGTGADDFDNNSEEQYRGEDLRLPLEVSLEDLYNGKLLAFRRVRSAHPENAEPRPCQCRDRMIRMEIINGVMRKVVDNNCPECQNRFDVTQKTSDLTIQIDQGMKDGDTITFYGEGDATAAHRAGDLIFVIRALPHNTFVRQGDNLRMKMDISLKEALVGFTRKIKRLDGTELDVKMDVVIHPGEVVKFLGEGMPLRRDPSQKGDLFVEFNVQFPHSLTDEQKREISKIL
jgi:DnaJ family protein B protein 11